MDKKRMGRPTKPPVSGERVSLGLRVTAEVKRALEAAARMSGRSISQEAEFRLEASLKSDKHILLVQGVMSTPVVFHKGEMLISDGYGVVALPVSSNERSRILDYFREQYGEESRRYTKEELDEAGDHHMQMLRDIERGK